MTDIHGMDAEHPPRVEPPKLIRPPQQLGAAESDFKPVDKAVEGLTPLAPQIAVQSVFRLPPQSDKQPKRKFTVVTFLLTVLMLFSVGAYFFQDRIVIFYENAGILTPSAEPTSETPNSVAATGQPEIPIKDAPASSLPRVPIADGILEEDILASLGTPDMKINYTDNAEYNCGLIGADLNNLDNYVSGCYTMEYENTITLYYGASTDYSMRYFVLLHEYGHYQQGQEGILNSPYYAVADAEADADCRSLNMGAVSDQVQCTIEGWTPQWLTTKYGISQN